MSGIDVSHLNKVNHFDFVVSGSYNKVGYKVLQDFRQLSTYLTQDWPETETRYDISWECLLLSLHRDYIFVHWKYNESKDFVSIRTNT